MGLGLAIGMDAMRACQAYPWWRGLLLRWCSSASVPRELIAASDREENIASVARFHGLLTELFCGLWVRRRAQVGLPDSSVRLRLVLTDLLPEDPAECRKYLLWRLADALDFQPELTRLAYMVLPSPLPGHRHAILCAVSGEKVVQQYERALAECRVRYSGLTPSSILLFNLFHQDLTGPPGSPILFLAATEASSTTVITLDGCPIFWRTRRLVGLSDAVGPALTQAVLTEITQDLPCLPGQRAERDVRGAPVQGTSRPDSVGASSFESGEAEVQRRLQVLRLAQALGNVSAACREAGVSRSTFYRWRCRFEHDGPDGLRPRNQPGRRHRTPPHVEHLVIGASHSSPAWGCRRLAAHLRNQGQAQVSPSTVQRILRRAGLGTRRERLLNRGHRAIVGAGLRTEENGGNRSVVAKSPGELMWVTNPPSNGPAPRGDWRGELLRDVSEAMAYVAEELGVGTPARLLVTGHLTEIPGLAGWLAAQLGVPADALDAGRLVRSLPWRLRREYWPRWEVALAAAAR